MTAQDHHENAIQTLLQNRIVYRPVYYSPITLRLNYQDTRSLNDPTLGGPAGLGPIRLSTKAYCSGSCAGTVY